MPACQKQRQTLQTHLGKHLQCKSWIKNSLHDANFYTWLFSRFFTLIWGAWPFQVQIPKRPTYQIIWYKWISRYAPPYTFIQISHRCIQVVPATRVRAVRNRSEIIYSFLVWVLYAPPYTFIQISPRCIQVVPPTRVRAVRNRSEIIYSFLVWVLYAPPYTFIQISHRCIQVVPATRVRAVRNRSEIIYSFLVWVLYSSTIHFHRVYTRAWPVSDRFLTGFWLISDPFVELLSSGEKQRQKFLGVVVVAALQW